MSLIVLLGTFIVYIIFTSEVTASIYINYRGYPPGVVCDSLLEAYGTDNVGYMAGLEYLYL